MRGWRMRPRGRWYGSVAGPWKSRGRRSKRAGKSPRKCTRQAAISNELLVADSGSAGIRAPVQPQSDQPGRIDWYYAGGVTGFHLLALLALFPWFFSWTGVLLVTLDMFVFGTL